MVRITSGGSPNQNGDLGSTWVAWARSADPRTSANSEMSTEVVSGSSRHVLPPLAPLGVERRLEPELFELLVDLPESGHREHRVVELVGLPGRARLGEPVRVPGRSEGGQSDLVDPQMVGVGVAGLLVAVDHHDLGSGAADDGHQPAHGLVERRLGEAVGIGVGLRPGHARVPVAEHDDLVVADDLGWPGSSSSTRSSAIRAWTSGGSMAGLRTSPSSPPVQQTSTVWTPCGVVLGDGPRPLGRLVIGVGMNGEQAERLRHGDHATGQRGPKLQLPGCEEGTHQHERDEAPVGDCPGQDQQVAGQGRGSARVPRPLLPEAAREPPEGPPQRGRRDHGQEAHRAAGHPAATAGGQAPAAGQGRPDPGQRGPGPGGPRPPHGHSAASSTISRPSTSRSPTRSRSWSPPPRSSRPRWTPSAPRRRP